MRKLLIFAFVAMFAMLGTAAVAGAKSRDRDRDRLPDKWEKKYKLSTSKNSARQDNDHDGLNNRGEFLLGDNPRDADSDNDGIEDGDENGGVIDSFDATTGTLVITLAPNGTLTGKVDSTTELECDDSASATTSSRGDDDSGDDDRGDDDRGDDGNGNCTSAALVKGAKVDEAELRGNGVFEKVELGS
jgi:hypothetical protein